MNITGNINPQNISGKLGGYRLPIASGTKLGGIKVGENLTISEDGTLSAAGAELPIKPLHSEEGYILLEELEFGTYICIDDYLWLENFGGAVFTLDKGSIVQYNMNGVLNIINADGFFFTSAYNEFIDLDIVATTGDLQQYVNSFEPITNYELYPNDTWYLLPNNRYSYELAMAGITITIARLDTIKVNGGRFSLAFTSPATATSINYPNEIYWRGDDLVSGKFVPQANKRYNISFNYDGKIIIAEVRGVDYAS